MIYIFMLIGFMLQSLIFFVLAYFNHPNLGGVVVYAVFFVLFVIAISIPVKKIKKEVMIILGGGDSRDADSDIARLKANGSYALAERYWRFYLLWSSITGAYFSWMIVIFYFVITRGFK